MRSPCVILAAEVLTSLGFGLDRVWSEILAGTCGLRPMARFAHGRYRTDVAGEVPADVEAILRERTGLARASRAYLFSMSVAAGVMASAPAGNLGRTALVLATTKADLDEFEAAADCGASEGPRHFNPARLAEALSADLGLAGPVMAVSGACASGTMAMVQAARLLNRGDADRALVVGVDVLTAFVLAGFSALNALSSAPCRPYDEARDGLSLGEGAGAILLARQQRDLPSLATVRGWGISNDASHITGPSRTGAGLRRALTDALEMSGLTPGDIHHVNGHGTGTVYNDEMEAQALAAVFADARGTSQGVPPVASVKGHFGHTLGAAGVVEVALCLPAMRERTVPPTLGFTRVGTSPPINVAGRPRRLDRLSTVVSMKSGFGGMNAVVVMSQVAGPLPKPAPSEGPETVVGRLARSRSVSRTPLGSEGEP